VATKHIILGILWMSFCVLHSLLASPKAKKIAETLLKQHFKFYRLYYSLFAFISLVLVLLFFINTPSFFLFERHFFSFTAGSIIGLGGLTIMFICIKKYFAQLSGIKSLYLSEKSSHKLMITGIHNYLRHPLYAGTFLFIWGLWLLIPLLSLLITNLIITIYTIIGIRWEEQKLEAEFGESYQQYKQKVPKLIPFLKLKAGFGHHSKNI
jgi:protein-S-isoprenylcysteine O-methyltransferase Ste14